MRRAYEVGEEKKKNSDIQTNSLIGNTTLGIRLLSCILMFGILFCRPWY